MVSPPSLDPMAFAPSVSDVATVLKFAWNVYSSCRAAPTEFRRSTEKVHALSLNLTESQSIADDPHSIINTNRSKRKSFETYLGYCHNALQVVQGILQKYSDKNMSVTQRLKWVASDTSAFDDAMAHLEFMITRFDKFMEMIDRRFIGASKIEAALDDESDAGRAVRNTIQGRTGVSQAQQQNLLNYAQLSLSPSGGAHCRWNVTGAGNPGCYLECWTVTKASVLGYTDFKKEKESRGQWKLRGMAKDFQTRNRKISSETDDDRVGYILKFRRAAELDSRYQWSFVGARIERQDSAALGIANVEVVMVIIGRRSTMAAGNMFPPTQANCRYGASCRNPSCRYKHPTAGPCWHGTTCNNPACPYAHLPQHTTMCSDKASYKDPKCRYRHPAAAPCRYGTGCNDSSCEYAHLPQNATLCREKASCRKPSCRYKHPTARPCWRGSSCQNPKCEYAHLPQHVVLCRDLGHCTNSNCKYNHTAVQ